MEVALRNGTLTFFMAHVDSILWLVRRIVYMSNKDVVMMMTLALVVVVVGSLILLVIDGMDADSLTKRARTQTHANCNQVKHKPMQWMKRTNATNTVQTLTREWGLERVDVDVVVKGARVLSLSHALTLVGSRSRERASTCYSKFGNSRRRTKYTPIKGGKTYTHKLSYLLHKIFQYFH